VAEPKNVVLRVRVSNRTYQTLKETAKRRTKGKVSPLVRHYILEELKKDQRKCPTVVNK